MKNKTLTVRHRMSKPRQLHGAMCIVHCMNLNQKMTKVTTQPANKIPKSNLTQSSKPIASPITITITQAQEYNVITVAE